MVGGGGQCSVDTGHPPCSSGVLFDVMHDRVEMYYKDGSKPMLLLISPELCICNLYCQTYWTFILCSCMKMVLVGSNINLS